VTRASVVSEQSTVRRTTAHAGSPVARLVLRTVLIVTVAALIVAGAIAIGNSPLGAQIPGTSFPSGDAGRQGGPPEVAAGSSTNAEQPTATTPAVGRTRAAASGANLAGTSIGQGLFSGRNAPSLQRGWPEEARYFGMFAIMTALVALALRVLRPRRKRAQPARLSAGA
jgi:hypothetical protein